MSVVCRYYDQYQIQNTKLTSRQQLEGGGMDWFVHHGFDAKRAHSSGDRPVKNKTSA